MEFNPKIHQRRSVRLKGYDYSHEGAYFITICSHEKICRFGEIDKPVADHISEPQMILNEFGSIAYDEWTKLPNRFGNMELDVFQIMPNHMHGIIVLENPGKNETAEKDGETRARTPIIGDIVGAYKSLVTKECLDLFKKHIKTSEIPIGETMGKIWQRSFHDHIIRSEKRYHLICNYIINNPSKWMDDVFYSR